MTARPTSARELDFTPVFEVTPSPRDWRDQFIYHLLIDRFDDANPDTPPFDPDRAAASEAGRDDGCRFQGGKIKGVTRRLDYLQGLGVTTIWISPPFKNRQDCDFSCHGYGIQDFLAVDPRFGTMEDLRELVRAAHARGMYVVLDIIINHTGDNWGYKDDQKLPYNETGPYDFGFWRRSNCERTASSPSPGTPREGRGEGSSVGADDAVWPVELQDPDAYKRRGHIRDMGGASLEEAINGDFESLKDLDLTRPQVLDTLIRVYKWWIAQTDCDGYRIDTVKHTEPEPTAIFCNAIHEYAKSIGKDNFFLFGELVAGDELLQKYVGSNTPTDPDTRYPLLDAVLDFPLYFVLEEVIKGLAAPGALIERYEKFRHFYRDYSQAGQYFVTFLDNHDQMHRPYRRFMANERDPNLAVIGAGYLLTSLGIPCLYYGTEQCFDGGGTSDVAVRENMFGGRFGAFRTSGMHFFRPDHPAYQGIARVAQVRAAERPLRYGRQYFRDISGNGSDFGPPNAGKCTLAYARVLDTTSIVVAMNLDAQERNDHVAVDANLNPPGTVLTDLLSGRAYEVKTSPTGIACVHVPLKAREMVILKPNA
jgi:glycosidase